VLTNQKYIVPWPIRFCKMFRHYWCLRYNGLSRYWIKLEKHCQMNTKRC